MSRRATLKPNPAERAGAGLAVAAVLAGLGWLLSTALGVQAPQAVSRALQSFDVAPSPPPPRPEPRPKRVASRAPRDAPAPPAKRADPTRVVAPKPLVIPPVPPPPVIAAPLPGAGAAPSVGAAAAGSGTGAGGAGNGRGGGGDDGGVELRLIRDKKPGELPPAARRLNGVRVVGMRWVVGTDGRVRDCRVVRSSGDPELDDQTCELLTRELRYAPARDRYGRAVAVTVNDAEQRWEVAHEGGRAPNGDWDGDDPS